jgi:hypothetical protein
MKDTGLWLMAKLARISMNVMNYQEPVLRNVSTLLESILANVILIFTKKSPMVKLAND